MKQSHGDAEPAVLEFDADVLDGGDATSTITVCLSASAYDNACYSLAFLFVECDCSKDHFLSQRISGGSPYTKKDAADNLTRNALAWA